MQTCLVMKVPNPHGIVNSQDTDFLKYSTLCTGCVVAFCQLNQYNTFTQVRTGCFIFEYHDRVTFDLLKNAWNLSVSTCSFCSLFTNPLGCRETGSSDNMQEQCRVAFLSTQAVSLSSSECGAEPGAFHSVRNRTGWEVSRKIIIVVVGAVVVVFAAAAAALSGQCRVTLTFLPSRHVRHVLSWRPSDAPWRW